MWWLPLAVGVGQSIYGGWQTNRAKTEASAARSRMEASRPGIPESADRMVSRAERMYTEGMPQDRQREAIGQQTAAGVSAMERGAVSSSQMLGGVTDMYRSELEQMNRLASEQAAFRLQSSQGVQGALQHRAGYEHQNAMMPYQENMMDYQGAMQAGQAGVQNMWGGMQTALGGVMNWDSGEKQRKMLMDIYGKNPVKTGFSMDSLQAKGVYNSYLNYTPIQQQPNYNIWR